MIRTFLFVGVLLALCLNVFAVGTDKPKIIPNRKVVGDGLRKKKSVVWAPAILRYVFGVLRIVPGSVWRKLDR